MNVDDLLNAYRSIWNNRVLATGGQTSEKILRDAITRELLDEISHPRVRKNKYEKYFLAIKRVMESSVPSETKLQLIYFYMNVMKEIN